MADLPYMMMNWGRFFADAKVAVLEPEAQGIYALLLGRMWLNEGWLAADDKVICRVLGIDIRRWRSVYKPAIEPLLRREIVAHVGPIYTQKHLQEVRRSSLAISEKNVARTAAARAAIAAKRGRKPTVTDEKQRPVTKPVTATVTEPVTETATVSKEQPQQNKGSTLHVESPYSDAAPETLAALPPRDHVDRTKSPPDEGGLPVMSPLPAMPAAELEGERSGLTKRLVAEGLKPKRGLLGSLDMGKR